jgi:hypothetical protein
MDGFRSLFSGDELRSATDVRGCQVESVHGSQSVLFSASTCGLVDSFEIAHPFRVTKKSVLKGCLGPSLMKSSFWRDFEIEK